MKHIVLAGVQGSGKGTQSRILVENYGYKTFEMGAELRKIAEEDSELGRGVKTRLAEGKMISIDIVGEIIKNRISNLKEGEKLIFDGFPRNREQKELFDSFGLDFAVVYLDMPKEMVEERLLNRKTCAGCGKAFKKSYEGACDSCGSTDYKIRDDDKDTDAIKQRIKIFFEDTLPVIEEYKESGKYYTVDATGSIEQVAEDIKKVL